MKTIIMQMLKYHTKKKKLPTEKQGKQLKIDLNESKWKGWGPKSSS